MRTILNTIKSEDIIVSAAKNRMQIASYLEDASEYDDKSTFFLKKGDYEKAAECAILAQEYIRLASDVKIEDMRLHATYN